MFQLGLQSCSSLSRHLRTPVQRHAACNKRSNNPCTSVQRPQMTSPLCSRRDAKCVCFPVLASELLVSDLCCSSVYSKLKAPLRSRQKADTAPATSPASGHRQHHCDTETWQIWAWWQSARRKLRRAPNKHREHFGKKVNQLKLM